MKECTLCHICFEDTFSLCPQDDRALVMTIEGSRVLDDTYRLEQRLGGGGMGIVYRAVHLGLQKTFALKLIRPSTSALDPAFLARFRREAEVLGRLKHSNIVDVTDFGIDSRGDGLPYLVMEYVQGTDLHGYGRLKGPLSLQEAVPILESIADAVDYAHAQGILHRDLKPDNVILCKTESGASVVKIVDFGLAGFRANAVEPGHSGNWIADMDNPETGETLGVSEFRASAPSQTEVLPEELAPQHLTAPGILLGTPIYMSPELIQTGAASTASDIYAFGILAFEMLVGKPPFRGTIARILNDQIHTMPPVASALNPALPQKLDLTLLEPLEKNPDRRTASAKEVVRRIRMVHTNAVRQKWLEVEIPRRLRLAILLSLILTLLSAFYWKWDRIERLEGATVDSRFAAVPQSQPDPAILLVLLDEGSLEADPRPLSERADEFGTRLQRVFDAGARSIAIDFLLHVNWSQSIEFSRLVLAHADSLTLPAYSQQGRTIGPECISGLTAAALGPGPALRIFAFSNLDADSDGVTRRMHLLYQDQQGGKRFALATRAVSVFSSTNFPDEPNYRFWIDYSIDWRKFPRISWKDLPTLVEQQPTLFRNRLIFVGGDFLASGDDAHAIPHHAHTPSEVSGVVLQALIANTVLSRFPIHEVSSAPVLIGIGFFTAAALTAFLCFPRLTLPASLCASSAFLYVFASYLFFYGKKILLPLAGPALTILLAVSIVLLLRWKLPKFPDPGRMT